MGTQMRDTQGVSSPSLLPLLIGTYNASHMHYCNHLLTGLPISCVSSATIHTNKLWSYNTSLKMASHCLHIKYKYLTDIKDPTDWPRLTLPGFPLTYCSPPCQPYWSTTVSWNTLSLFSPHLPLSLNLLQGTAWLPFPSLTREILPTFQNLSPVPLLP